jgi:hypothetical protein
MSKKYTTEHFSQMAVRKKNDKMFLLGRQPRENYRFSLFKKVGTGLSKIRIKRRVLEKAVNINKFSTWIINPGNITDFICLEN